MFCMLWIKRIGLFVKCMQHDPSHNVLKCRNRKAHESDVDCSGTVRFLIRRVMPKDRPTLPHTVRVNVLNN